MKNYKFTFIGLFISYFSIVLTGLSFKKLNGGPLGDGLTIARELLIFILVGVLFWIILKKEHLPLDSIGLSKKTWKETTLWTIITCLFCLIGIFISLGIIHSLGWKFGKSGQPVKLSMLTTTLVMLRAGIGEEVFFRGYIYERLNLLLKNKWFAVALSLIPFALLHYTQGPPGILLAFVLGGILTALTTGLSKSYQYPELL